MSNNYKIEIFLNKFRVKLNLRKIFADNNLVKNHLFKVYDLFF